jgi:citrate lyase subunit beta / citryl-CoA lyase
MIGPLRSMLYVPGVRQDRFGKAMSAGADAVVFDLEDSVEADQKEKARSLIAEFLATPSTGPMRLVRFNAIHSSAGEADLEFFSTRTGFDGILLPKVETTGLVEMVARAFARHAPGGRVPPLFVMLETPSAVLRAGDIATADAPIAALLFGAEDFTAALGVERTTDGEELLLARGQIALAAAAAGAEAIDAVFTDLTDPDGLRRDCRRARGLGFRGKMAIHPKQIEIINQAFTPSSAEVERARRVIEAYETARAAGQAVTTLEGKMVELPIVERARRVLALPPPTQ